MIFMRILTSTFQLFSTTPSLKQLLNASKSKTAPVADASSYDPRKRDPQYAHAFATPIYELVRLTIVPLPRPR